MYEIRKTLTIAVAHKLGLDYESKCSNMHGHNLRITVFCRSKDLNENGMVLDFTEIKNTVMKYDHRCLNDMVPFRDDPPVLKGQNPTAENLAREIQEFIPFCYRVEVEETEGNMAAYEFTDDD